jgi:hypothetical protein
MLLILYGHKVVSSEDELVKITAEAAEVLSNKIAAGTKVWAVDILPFRECQRVRTVKQSSLFFPSPIYPLVVPWGHLQATCGGVESYHRTISKCPV